LGCLVTRPFAVGESRPASGQLPSMARLRHRLAGASARPAFRACAACVVAGLPRRAAGGARLVSWPLRACPWAHRPRLVIRSPLARGAFCLRPVAFPAIAVGADCCWPLVCAAARTRSRPGVSALLAQRARRVPVAAFARRSPAWPAGAAGRSRRRLCCRRCIALMRFSLCVRCACSDRFLRPAWAAGGCAGVRALWR